MSTPLPKSPAVPPFGAAQCDAASCARDRIFEAARNLFYRYGIRGVSVDQIAAEASTTKVTLYRVFDSKDDLVVKVLEDHTKHFLEWWDSVVAPYVGDPRKQLDTLFESLADEVCVHAGRGCPVANTAVEIVDDDHPAKRIIHEHCQEIARRLRSLCLEMGARQPDTLGDALALLIDGTFAARVVFHNGDQAAAVPSAARALLDSPELGVGSRTKT